jgi:CBS domain-containing membrane protein
MPETKVPRKVADIMTRNIIALAEGDRLHSVQEAMQKYRFRHLPVVRGKKLVGLITHRDMLRISSSTFSTQRETRDHLINYMPAFKIMRTEVATVRPDTSLAEAGQILWDRKLGCVCVVDDDENLLGILTEADFVRLAVRLVNQLSDG